MEGTLLEGNPDITIDELSISETEFLLVEIRSPRENWFFTQEGVKQIVKCNFCNKYDENFITCICNKVYFIFFSQHISGSFIISHRNII